ncbi:MAG: phage tail tape measure protein [Desulfovibrio sp.]|jgi:TP901 family phage tail tape measure protein/lambda family phage tail tape measure protein
MPETRIIISARDLSSATFQQVEGRVRRMRGEFAQANTGMAAFTATAKKAVAALAGIQVVDFARSMVQGFAEFDKGLVGVAKTTNMGGQALAELGAAIDTMTTRLPLAATELLSIAQAAGQLGVSGHDHILRFTETVGMLGMASDLVGEEAATTLARMLTVTGESMDSVGRLGSVIVALGNSMAATESEIANMGTQVAQATAVFGVSSAEASALGAALRSMGVRAELGGSTVGRAFRAIDDALRNGGARLEYLSRLTGMTGEELTRVFGTDAVTVFQRFVEGLGRAVNQGQSATKVLGAFELSGEEVLKVLPTMAKRSSELGRALAIANAQLRDGTALTREAAAASHSHAAKMQIEANKTALLARKTGQDLAPAFETAARAAAVLVGWLDRIGTRLGKNIFMVRELVQGNVGIFDAALWSTSGTDAYLKRLEDGSAALLRAEQELARLGSRAQPRNAAEARALREAIALQTEKVRLLREWALEEQQAGQGVQEASGGRMEGIPLGQGFTEAVGDASIGADNTEGGDLTPPPAASEGETAKAVERLLRQWQEYYQERKLSASQFIAWQLDQEEQAFRASDVYLQSSLRQRRELVDGFNRYREAKLAEQQEQRGRTVREALLLAQQSALSAGPRSGQMRAELDLEMAEYRKREGYVLASDEQRRRMDESYAEWRSAREREITRQIQREQLERQRPVQEALHASRQAALSVAPRSEQLRAEMERELAEYRTRDGYLAASDAQRRRMDGDYATWRAARETALTEQLNAEQRERLATSDSLLDGMALGFERWAEQTEGAAGKVADVFTGMFSGIDAAMGELTSTGELDFSRMVSAWLADIGRLSSQQLLTGPLAALFSGTGASEAGGLVSMFANMFHSGGVVGGPGSGSRAVSPLYFAGAGRYHGGGVAGLRPDEEPIIALRGEEVLTRRDPRHRENLVAPHGRGAGGAAADRVGVRIINSLDPGIVRNYLDSSEGERVILNVIRRNPQILRG